VRISAPYSNNSIKTALADRHRLLESSLLTESAAVNFDKPCFYEENSKIIRQRKLNLTQLTPVEKGEIAVKYKSGMTMSAIAEIYGCHYTTVGRILRRKGII
jgi:DNA-directed RNA polymerase specialized sigma24 family protein